ncbi:RbsD/FucU family protein [Microlunatus antarcticus]|uniref:L-fucose mutarotase n=1 Tax=Microlunatus antarcticus TaxID=53388 RepID=A0A7W5JWU4_9ACTN|nr:L-fucose mutarotase [Microlunatus antarcticus]
MLNYTLTHPPLLRALAAAGHGSQVLLADGNYPAATAKPAGAEVIHLNLRPGLLSVTEVLGPLLDAVNIEAGRVMALPDGGAVPAHAEYEQMLGAQVDFAVMERFAFYDAARGPDVAFVVATGDQRICANLLLTIGVRT